MLIQLHQLSSLIHCMAAQALAGGRKDQEGAFLVNLNAHPALASGSGSTSLISEAPSACGIAPLLPPSPTPYLRVIFVSVRMTVRPRKQRHWHNQRNGAEAGTP